MPRVRPPAWSRHFADGINLIVADVSFRVPLYDDILALPHQRVLVMLPTLSSVRAMLRHLFCAGERGADSPSGHRAEPIGVSWQSDTPEGRRGTRREGQRRRSGSARQVETAATLGELAMNSRGGFRNGILELAGQVAHVGLLDSAASVGPPKAEGRARHGWSLFRRKP